MKKILSLGTGQSDFLLHLYADIKKSIGNLSFTIDNYIDLSNGKVKDESNTIFNKKTHLDKISIGFNDFIKSALNILKYKVFYKIVFFELQQNLSVIYILKIAKRQITYNARITKFLRKNEYDLFHFHFCTPYNLRFIHYLPKNTPVICSFGGSDLYRRNSKEDIYYTKLALKKSTAITVQTEEILDDVVKKYGVFLKEKIKIAKFSLSKEIFNKIKANIKATKKIDKLKKELHIPVENTVITVGYNAFKENNHIQIIEQLCKLPKKELNKISIIIPLAYGRKPQYIEQLKTYCKSSTDVNVIFFEDFLNQDELSLLRIISNIQIQMPISDALSGSITEVLYAGNNVIAGSWLPYKIYDRIGIKIHYADAFSNVNSVLIKLLNTPKKTTKNIENIQKTILENFFSNYTKLNWIKLYSDLLNLNKND